MKKTITISMILGVWASVFAIEIMATSRYREWTPSAETMPLMLTISTDTTRNNVGAEQPLQVLYAIDVSERFAGNIRQEMIMGGRQLVNQLSDNDFFGIIVYSDFARTILPLSQIGFTGRERINTLLSEISTERGRDVLAALKTIVQEFEQNQGRRNDGRSLVLSVLGETLEDGLGNSYAPQMIAAMKNLGVQVYTIGHGDDFDEIAAISLAEQTGGRAYFVGRERTDLLRSRFERMAPRVAAPVHSSKIEIEFLTRDGIEIRHFQDSIAIKKAYIPKLIHGDSINLFFELRNRPRRNSDVEIDFNYENITMRSNLSGSASFRVSLARGNSSNFAEKAEQVIKYQLLFNMAQTIDELKIGDRAFRRAYAEGFRNLLETRLGHIRNDINTRGIQLFWNEMIALHDIINGGTASNEFIAKMVRYHLHNVRFPE